MSYAGDPSRKVSAGQAPTRVIVTNRSLSHDASSMRETREETRQRSTGAPPDARTRGDFDGSLSCLRDWAAKTMFSRHRYLPARAACDRLRERMEDRRMKHCVVIVAALATTAGCSRSTPTSTASAEFDRQWSALSTAVPDTFYIEDDRAAGLMGNVARLPDTRAEEPLAPLGGPLPVQLDMSEISKTIRGNLSAVKVCYMREQRKVPRSGKAIVKFEINTDGRVGSVAVNAPAFTGTDLPGCIGGHVRRMTFPKFQKGPQSVSYPFVFVGS
jgi:hypothetical protein